MSALCRIILLLLGCWCSQSWGHWLYQHTGQKEKKADIYFLLDTSSSVFSGDHKKQLQFVSDLVGDMDIGPSATRVGVGVFAVEHTQCVALNEFSDKATLQDAILKRCRQNTGLTYISRALKGMREVGLAPSITRPGVPHIGVLLTDGDNNMSSHQQLIADNATLAKREGIFIFTVSIGHTVNEVKIRNIASDPKNVFAFSVRDYYGLTNIQAEFSRRLSEVDVLEGDKGSCGSSTLVDTVFVFDEAALGQSDTQKVKRFVTAVVKNFSMNSGNVRVGVISKICPKTKDINLGQYVTKDDFKAGLDADNKGTGIGELIERARRESFLPENGGRTDWKTKVKRRIVILLHATVSMNNEDDYWMGIYRAKFNSVEIFVIQMGGEYNKQFITSLASDADKAFFTDSPDHLIQQKDKFIQSFCKDV